jgi:hypothetical protein
MIKVEEKIKGRYDQMQIGVNMIKGELPAIWGMIQDENDESVGVNIRTFQRFERRWRILRVICRSQRTCCTILLSQIKDTRMQMTGLQSIDDMTMYSILHAYITHGLQYMICCI